MATIGNLRIVISAEAGQVGRALASVIASTRTAARAVADAGAAMGAGLKQGLEFGATGATAALAALQQTITALKARIEQSLGGILSLSRHWFELTEAVNLARSGHESWHWANTIIGPNKLVQVLDRLKSAVLGIQPPMRLLAKVLLELIVPALQALGETLASSGLASARTLGANLTKLAAEMERLGKSAGGLRVALATRLLGAVIGLGGAARASAGALVSLGASLFAAGPAAAAASTGFRSAASSAGAMGAALRTTGVAGTTTRALVSEFAPLVAVFGVLASGAIYAAHTLIAWARENQTVIAVMGVLTSAVNTVAQTVATQWELIKAAFDFSEQNGTLLEFVTSLQATLLPVITTIFEETGERIRAWGALVVGTLAYFRDNWRSAMQLAAVTAQYEMVRAGNVIVYWITEVIPGYLRWFGDNWREIFHTMFDYTTTVFINLGTNIRGFFSELWEFISSGGTSGWDFVWKPLTEGFVNSIREMPNIAERQIGELEGQLGKQMADLAKTNAAELAKSVGAEATEQGKRVREAMQKAKETAQATTPTASATAPTADTTRAPKSAGALYAGSAAALQAIAAAQGGTTGKSDHQKRTAEESRRSREYLQKMWEAQQKRNAENSTQIGTVIFR